MVRLQCSGDIWHDCCRRSNIKSEDCARISSMLIAGALPPSLPLRSTAPPPAPLPPLPRPHPPEELICFRMFLRWRWIWFSFAAPQPNLPSVATLPLKHTIIHSKPPTSPTSSLFTHASSAYKKQNKRNLPISSLLTNVCNALAQLDLLGRPQNVAALLERW